MTYFTKMTLLIAMLLSISFNSFSETSNHSEGKGNIDYNNTTNPRPINTTNNLCIRNNKGDDFREIKKDTYKDTNHVYLKDHIALCKNILKKSARRYGEGENDIKIFQEIEFATQILAICEVKGVFETLNNNEKSNLSKSKFELNEKVQQLSKEKRNYLDKLRKKVIASLGQHTKTEDKKELENYTDQEIKDLDLELKRIWRNMVNSLVKYKIEEAVSYYHIEVRDTHRKKFTKMPKEILNLLAQNLNNAQLFFDEVSAGRVIYHLIQTQNGQRYSFQLTFVKSLDGIWQIYGY